MSSPFGDLVLRTDEARREFDSQPALLDAVADGMSVARYRAFLLELYHIVWHFNPVTAVATARMPDSLREVRYFLYQHMQEEMGHELWVLNDLEAVGVARPVAEAHRAGPFTLAMTGYNYWVAEHRHPASVLGMLYALEVVASVYGGPFSAAIRESLMLDGDAGISFLKEQQWKTPGFATAFATTGEVAATVEAATRPPSRAPTSTSAATGAATARPDSCTRARR